MLQMGQFMMLVSGGHGKDAADIRLDLSESAMTQQTSISFLKIGKSVAFITACWATGLA
jgi:hypothetical protein